MNADGTDLFRNQQHQAAFAAGARGLVLVLDRVLLVAD
jgi:hypothetical protein